ncbi:hypothetical protein PSEUDO8BK_10917 [Pseudomonas sp. 8BK]|uniref:beta strand repeat-containing protein n=1 Tax=Pseudomonas sp. 8BK TaxID=2653164 RepID=UPI0012F055D6|nr:hypothetical protein PSEUDO8BK_10917 [Pseudomonas sp. 8BK]
MPAGVTGFTVSVPTLTDTVTAEPVETVTLTIGGQTGNGGIIDVNQAPVASPSIATGAEDQLLTLTWTNFGVSDVDSASSNLAVVITELPSNGTLQYQLSNGSWASVTQNQTVSKTDVDAGKLRFTPDTNESGIDAFGGSGVGNQQADYAHIGFRPTDGTNLGGTATLTIDITPTADIPALNLNDQLNLPDGSGLLVQTWTGLPLGTNGNGANPNDLQSVIDQAGAPSGTATLSDVNNSGVAAGTASKVSGLIYLEAGQTYTFSGVGDDSIRVVVGGNNVAQATWSPGSGQFNGSFTPASSGYYTLGIYHHNQSGPGSYDVNVSVNGGAAQNLSSTNFDLFPNSSAITDQGVRLSDLQTDLSGSFYRPFSINEGNEDSSIPLSSITAGLVDTDGSETLVINIAGLPEGAILSDGTRVFTASAGNTIADVSGWTLNNLSLTPPQNFNGTLNLSVTATATEQANGDQAIATQNLVVTVHPVNDAPSAANVALTGSEDTALSLGWGQFDAQDVDNTAAELSIVINSLPSTGTLQYNAGSGWTNVSQGQSFTQAEIAAGQLRYVPQTNASGDNDTAFSYQVSDGSLLSPPATVSISISPVVDAPLLQASVSTAQIGMTQLFLSTFDSTPSMPTNQNFYSSADGWTPGTGATTIEVRDATQNSSSEQGYSGTRYVELNSATSFDNTPSISRTVATEAGSFYTLSFQYTPRPGYGADVNVFEVLVDGQVVGTFSANGLGLSTTSWREGSVNFIGTGANQTIELRETSSSDQADGRGMFLDNIALSTASQYSYDISVDARLTDTDGSESLQVIIDGVPVGSVLQNSSGSLVANGNGQYILNSNQLIGLKLVSNQDLHNVQLNIQAVSTENATSESVSRSTQLMINSVEASDNFAQAVVSLRTSEASSQSNLTASDARNGGATETAGAFFTVSGGSATLAFNTAFNSNNSNSDTFQFRLQQWNGSSWSTPSYQTLNAGSSPISGLVDGATYRLQIRVQDNSNNSSNASVTLSNLVLTTTLTNPVTEVSATAGNVLTDSNNYLQSSDNWGAIDALGAEGAVITSVNVNGINSTVAATGNTLIAGQFGTLSIAANGSYTYTPTANMSNLGKTDTFTYTLTQPDGDTASANLVVAIANSPYSAPNLVTGNGTINGSAGSDLLIGNHEGDLLLGGGGNDRLEGGAGHDRLIGGTGNDILLGGKGADTFVWQTGHTGQDVIKDFNVGEGDRIDLHDLLQGENDVNILNYLRVDTATSTLLISSTGVLDASGSNADVTIKLENGGNPVNINPGNLSQADLVNSLIAGADPLIKIDHN